MRIAISMLTSLSRYRNEHYCLVRSMLPSPISILAVTGIRSEYDLLYPVLMCLRNDPTFAVRVVVSGAHLSDWHGKSWRTIADDGFSIADRIDSLVATDRATQRPKGVGMLVQALAQTVEREHPDMLFVVGDREESIATAIVGNYMDVLVVHLGGGDTVFGHADDPVRFATSKLAHVHCTYSSQSAANLVRVGEEAFRVFTVGNPALDRIRMVPEESPDAVSTALGCDLRDGRYIVCLQHPLSSEQTAAGEQMAVTLAALEQFCAVAQYRVISIAPNTDPGAYDMVGVIAAYGKKPWLHTFRNLDRRWFVNVMRHARALIGNSSMGILEAPYYRLPVVNVGHRQRGREQAGNVEFVPHDAAAIVAALRRACSDAGYRASIAALPNPFGDGHAAERIRDVMRSVDRSDPTWRIKRDLAGSLTVSYTGHGTSFLPYGEGNRNAR